MLRNSTTNFDYHRSLKMTYACQFSSYLLNESERQIATYLHVFHTTFDHEMTKTCFFLCNGWGGGFLLTLKMRWSGGCQEN